MRRTSVCQRMASWIVASDESQTLEEVTAAPSPAASSLMPNCSPFCGLHEMNPFVVIRQNIISAS